jgi:hypothetical protein
MPQNWAEITTMVFQLQIVNFKRNTFLISNSILGDVGIGGALRS